MKNIIIFIHKENSTIHDYEIESFIDFSRTYNTGVYIYASGFSSNILFFKEKLQKYNVFLNICSDASGFIATFKKLQEKYNILHLDTLQESMLGEVLSIKLQLGISSSENVHFFQNKNIQRNILSQSSYDKNLYSKVVNLPKVSLDEITKNITYPFVIKPIQGEESFGVDMIKNKGDFSAYLDDFPSENTYMIEEYIKGKIYSVDYFVDNNSQAFLNPVMQEKNAQEIGINDMFIYSCISHDKLDIEFTDDELALYIQETIRVGKIRHSFIHQEFKYTDSGFKTIEVNGRIGGRRMKTLRLAYKINILGFIIPSQTQRPICKNHVATFTIYPCKTGKFIGYNETLLDSIKKLPSFSSFKANPNKHIGNKISGTRNGQWNIGVIYLCHEAYDTFQKDYDFIESQYKELLIIE